MEITEKKYYCPKCFKQVNKQPGFDPLLSAWTCVNCGYEFKINNTENYTAENIEPAKEAPIVDTDVIEYDNEVEEVTPVDEAPIEIPVEQTAQEEPEIVDQTNETVASESENTYETMANESDVTSEEKTIQTEDAQNTDVIEQAPIMEEKVVQSESDQESEDISDLVEETIVEEPSDVNAKQDFEIEQDQDETSANGSESISFSSDAENEEVQEKKVGFFGKLFGDEKPREKSKHVLDFLRDEDEEQEETSQEVTEPAEDNNTYASNEVDIPNRTYESNVSYFSSDDSDNTADTEEAYVPSPSFASDPFEMQSEQQALESEINMEETPKKPGFIGSFFEKQEQKQTEKDVVRMQRDRERMEQAIDRRDYRRKKRRKWLVAHWTWVAAAVVFLILACFGGYKFFQWRKLTPVGIDPQACVDQNYVEVVEEFANNGFTNVQSVPVEDLSMTNLEHEGEVISISINSTLTFTPESKFPYDAPVIIQYHSAAKVSAPMSSRDAKKLTYTEVVAKFKEAGFENIDIIPQADLITGWLHSDGSVARITIGGNEKFNTGDAYRVDSKVVVTYHTFPSNETQKDEDKKEESKKEESKKDESKKDESKTDSSKTEESTEDTSSKDDSKSDAKTNNKK